MIASPAPLPPGLLLKRALDAAAVWHADQFRKYPGVRVPYVSHIAGVVSILARHGLPEEAQAAGALHDVLEDTAATYEELRARFGERVAELVRWVSEEDKSLPWEERKRQYLERFPGKPWEAQAITLADKIDNLRSIVVCALDHGDPWAQFKRGRAAQLQRFDALLEAARALPPHPLPNALPHALPGALPHALPGALPHALPGALPHALPGALPHALPSALPHALPSALVDEYAQALAGARRVDEDGRVTADGPWDGV